MITFRKKAFTEDLIPEAIKQLDREGVSYKLIPESIIINKKNEFN